VCSSDLGFLFKNDYLCRTDDKIQKI